MLEYIKWIFCPHNWEIVEKFRKDYCHSCKWYRSAKNVMRCTKCTRQEVIRINIY